MDICSTRQKILTASRNVFTKNGFHNTKMQKIADVAGVGKGTIYEYFSSKTELFETMIKDIANGFKEIFIEKIGQCTSFEEKLKMLAEIQFDIDRNHTYLESLVFKNLSGFDEGLMEWLKAFNVEMVEFIAGIMEEGVAAGNIKTMDPKLAAVIYIGGAHMLSHYVCDQKEREYGDVKKEALDMFYEITFKGLGI